MAVFQSTNVKKSKTIKHLATTTTAVWFTAISHSTPNSVKFCSEYRSNTSVLQKFLPAFKVLLLYTCLCCCQQQNHYFNHVDKTNPCIQAYCLGLKLENTSEYALFQIRRNVSYLSFYDYFPLVLDTLATVH